MNTKGELGVIPNPFYQLEDLITDKQLAERWNKSLKTLCHWRCYKFGPPHLKIGNNIFYRVKDITLFEQGCLQNTSLETSYQK